MSNSGTSIDQSQINQTQANQKNAHQKFDLKKLVVQKYGGATLSTPEKIKAVAVKISELKRSGHSVVAVVSAMGQTTNQLIELSQQVSKNPSLREMDMLISVGERISMSLLSMALNDLGVEAISFTGSQAGILTDDDHISANIIDVTPFRVKEALEKNKVVVLAGFQGVSKKTKEITTLGRGGSDITAIAMAFALNANRCEILKDVDSIFTADPNLIPNAKPIRHLNADQLFEMTFWGAKVLNYKSVERFRSAQMNKSHQPELYIGPAHKSAQSGTVVRADWTTENSNQRSSSFYFDQQSDSKILSINSISEAWLVSKNDFEKKLKLTQHNESSSTKTIPFNAAQVLTMAQDHLWLTAPQEILNQLKNQIQINDFRAVVTVTLTSDSEIKNMKAELEKNLNDFEFTTSESKFSIHLFCKSDDRKKLVERIHQLYFSLLMKV